MATGREIMVRAGVLLGDEDHVRWTLPELCDWINEATRAIVLAKPSASTRSQPLSLIRGTLQRVPIDGSPKPHSLVDVPRNLAETTEPRQGRRAIKPVNRETLDVQEPNWHDPRYVPYRKEVRHFIFDEANPLEFYVYPGNDGTGVVEAVMAVHPVPLAPTSDPNSLDSYQADLGLPDPYDVPIVDYVLFRSQSKDDLEGSAGRAAAHYQAFAAAIGLKIQVERATSVNARRT